MQKETESRLKYSEENLSKKILLYPYNWTKNKNEKLLWRYSYLR